MSASAHPLRLVDERHVADVGWGWVYAWNTARWFETGDSRDAIGPGAGPIVVVKQTMAGFTLDSTPSYQAQLVGYADMHDLGETGRLGWG